MKEIIFLIEEDPDGGYNAEGLGYSIFTEGETIEELRENVLDALKCHFDSEEDIPKIIRPHLIARIITNLYLTGIN